MAQVFPFKAIHYNTQLISNLDDVITPPYDVIPAGDVSKYLSRSPYNLAHVLMPRPEDEDYGLAAQTLHNWQANKILVEDEREGFYLYQQAFELHGKTHRRHTLFCAVQLHEFGDKVILPHENIYPKYKDDRLKILRKTQLNLSPIFGMVGDPMGKLHDLYEKWVYTPPLLHSVSSDDDIEHTVWKIETSKAQELIEHFASRPLYIVDGHHRYQSSLAYAKELGVLGKEHPAARMLFAVATFPDNNLAVLPTHRLIKEPPKKTISRNVIAESYELAPVSYEQLRSFVLSPQTLPAFIIFYAGELMLCTPRHWQTSVPELGESLAPLSVVWSDRKFMTQFCEIDDSNRGSRVAYEKNLETAWEKRDRTALTLFLPPLSVEQIAAVADDGKTLPQKSSYFYPKLASGLVIRKAIIS
ncbi:MAG: DUF1015 domain-containing protein [Deltaproteobacteria bacterium]|nr:DUF1015 domain-containing protein [Deltaproteobacteria bacterium]